jgi:hypothetical protein
VWFHPTEKLFIQYSAETGSDPGITQRSLVQAFTGQPSIYPLFAALPGYLRTISRSVPSGHPLADVDVAVRCHTLLPYFLTSLTSIRPHNGAKRKTYWQSKTAYIP